MARRVTIDLSEPEDFEERPAHIGMRQYWKFLPLAFPYVRPYRRLVIIAVLVTIGSSLIGLLEPWPLAFVIDNVLGRRPPPHLLSFLVSFSPGMKIFFAVAVGLGVALIGSGLSMLHEYVTTKLNLNVVLDFRSNLFAHVQRIGPSFFDDARVGDTMYRINYEAGAVGWVVVALLPLAQSILTLLAMFYIAFRIDPTLALLALTVVPFIYYSTGLYGTRIEPRLLEVRGIEGYSLTIVHEALTMLRASLAFGRERHEWRRFRSQGQSAVNARVSITVRQTFFSLAVRLITAGGTALVLGVGADHVLNRRLTIGQLLILLSYIAQIYGPLETLSSTTATFQQQLISLRMARRLLDVRPAVEDNPDAVPIPRVDGDLVFDDVSFNYKGRPEALKNLSFHVTPGQRVGVVGPTGAGKSTLLSLIPRFADASDGVVRIDGHDVRDVTIESLRSNVSIVFQDPLLFSGTVGANIGYGRAYATNEEIIEAAKAANAHDFITALPLQYDTEVGERGAKLSGGERQRICIARAFLKDAPILLLDEPTSSVDSKTESVILDALDRLMQNRTTVTVAHRLSTIRTADLILVMNAAEVVEQGTHEDLLALGGLYANLYEIQTRAPVRSRVKVEGPDEQYRRAAALQGAPRRRRLVPLRAAAAAPPSRP